MKERESLLNNRSAKNCGLGLLILDYPVGLYVLARNLANDLGNLGPTTLDRSLGIGVSSTALVGLGLIILAEIARGKKENKHK